MKAVIFAAGKGTRMQPLTFEKPKPLLEILGRPILERSFEALPDAVTEAIVVVGYKGDMIRAHFGAEFQGRKIEYLEQDPQLGTWNALTLAKPRIEGEEKFLVVNGDDIYGKDDLTRLIAHPRGLLVYEVADPRRFGVVVVDPSFRILDIEEGPDQPKSNLVNTGAYVLTPEFFAYEPQMSSRGEYLVTDGVQQFIHEYPVFAEHASLWIPIGYPEDLQRAEETLKKSGRA